MTIIQKLRDEITEREAKIKEIQEACSHPPICVIKEHHSNDADFGSRHYWTSFRCELCEKKWQEDGSK